MKHTLSIILVISLLVALVPMTVQAAKPAETQIGFTTDTISLTDTAKSFRVPVTLTLGSGADGLTTYVATVTWDRDKLELQTSVGDKGCLFGSTQSGEPSSVSAGSNVVNADAVKDGKLIVMSAKESNRSVSEGTLFVLTFRYIASEAGTAEIHVQPGSNTVLPENGVSSASGLLKVHKEAVTLQVKAGTGAKFLRGDINGDGYVKASDYVMLKRIILGTYTPSEDMKQRLDVNLDEKVTSADYVMLKRYILNTYRW